MTSASEQPETPNARSILGAIGPGIIAGAADDDPSGIATYSIAGARFGLTFLSTAVFTWPLMAAVQMMCAHIGMVTGLGLTEALRKKFPRSLLAVAAAALFFVNTLNIGADLNGMADAARLLTGVSSHIWVPVFAIAIAWATIRLRYATIARILKWMALFLAVYVIDAIHLGPSWRAAAGAAFHPHIPHSRAAWGMLVAILGTTISPYLFVWQASLEVEEEKSQGRATVAERRNATRAELFHRRVDIGAGTFVSNLAMFFIILTCAITLNAHGLTNLETSAQVAAALEPVAGRFAMLLYTIGIIGLGVLAIPTLAGSAAYALAEIFGWKQGIDEPYRKARRFYGVVALSIAIGWLMDFAHVNPVMALYYTAVVNGLLAPLLLVGILLAASDSKLMQGQPSSLLGRVVVGITTAVMAFAAVAMFVV